MSKRNKGKKHKTPGTYRANAEKMFERMEAHVLTHGPKKYPRPKPKSQNTSK